MPSILQMRDSLALQNRNKVDIENFLNRNQATPGNQKEVDDWIRKYPKSIPRTKAPCIKYNCHGLTFASRRTAIESSRDVQKILDADGYHRIDSKDIMAGDIVIFRASAESGGEIEHSGIVVDVSRRYPELIVSIPKIVSKWGYGHEAIHAVNDGPYSQASVEYYRVMP